MSPSEKTHEYRQNAELKRLFKKMEQDGFVPFFGPKEVNGLHGTSRTQAERILHEGFTTSPLNSNFYGQTDLLGEGLYFWEDSSGTGGLPAHSAGYRWAKHRYPKAEPAVIEAKVAFCRLLDLTHLQNVRFALEFKDRLKTDEHIRRSIGSRKPWFLWEEARFVKLLVLSCPKFAEIDIDGVRWNGLGLPDCYEITQTGVCVKDANCIKQISLFDSKKNG